MMRDLFSLSARLMQMDDDTWARHANPLSVWSRFSVLPLLTLAVVSRVWLGWAACLPIVLVIGWAYWNPRAFGLPRHGDSWAAKGTFGERLYLDRANRPIPRHHLTWARALTGLTLCGLPVWIYGLWRVEIWPILCGLILMMVGKAWFVDRMVWIYEDLSRADLDGPR